MNTGCIFDYVQYAFKHVLYGSGRLVMRLV